MKSLTLGLLLLLPLANSITAKPLEESPSKVSSSYTDFTKGKWIHQEEPLTNNGLPFWFYSDRKLKSGEKYPLVIALHGRRNKVKPNAVFKPQNIAKVWTEDKTFKKNPCFVVQPYYPPKGGWEKIPEKVDELVMELAENLPIDLKRIYLVGFSNGGQGTFQALARQPEWYAGAVTIAGPVSPKSVVGKIKAPIWCWVGENDTSLNKNVRLPALARKLQEVDNRVKLNIVPNGGHSCFPQSLGTEKVRKWLFEQRLP